MVNGTIDMPPAARSDGAPSYERAYANAARNARVQATAGAGPFRETWRTSMLRGAHARFAFVAGKRILADTGSHWQLFDDRGAALASGRHGSSGVDELLVDGARRLFYNTSHDGGISARWLSDGREAFALASYTGRLPPGLLARRPRSLVLASALDRGPHDEPIHEGRLDVVEAPETIPAEASPGLVDATRTRATRAVNDGLMLAALAGDDLVVAADAGNGPVLEWLDADTLQVRHRVAGTGAAAWHGLSLDERGNAYLAADLGDAERYALWGVARDGVRFLDVPLPAPPRQPPAITYDHRVIVVLEDRILVIGGGGTCDEITLPGPIASATVDGDDRVIVAHGDRLSAVDRSGRPTTLFSFRGERVATPAAIGEDGDLYVVAARALVRLSR